MKEFTELAGVSLRTSVIYGSIGKGRRFDPRDAQPFRLAKSWTSSIPMGPASMSAGKHYRQSQIIEAFRIVVGALLHASVRMCDTLTF